MKIIFMDYTWSHINISTHIKGRTVYVRIFFFKKFMHQNFIFLSTYHISFLCKAICCACRTAIFYSLLDLVGGSFEIMSLVSKEQVENVQNFDL